MIARFRAETVSLDTEHFFHKGQLIWKQIVKLRILPKNEQMNSFLLVCNVFSFVFLEESSSRKKRFEIIWPLKPSEFQILLMENSWVFVWIWLLSRVSKCLISEFPNKITDFGSLCDQSKTGFSHVWLFWDNEQRQKSKTFQIM